MAADSGFQLELVRSADQTKLRSVCLKCGEERVVSALDGSLQDWQTSHRCAKRPDGTGPITPVQPTGTDS